ncbi:MAG: hypothetical protein RID91_17410 [Azospirillaceae bacterium]
MTDTTERPTVRETVGVFHAPEDLRAAVEALGEHGFDHAELSLMASDKAVSERLGDVYRRVEDAMDDPATPRTAYVAPEDVGNAQGLVAGALAYVGAVAATGAVVASGGALAAAAGAAAIGGATSGAVGTLFAKWLGDRYARDLGEHLDKGGLLLWVRVTDREREGTAEDVLKRHKAEPVSTHDLPAEERTASQST